MKTLRFLLVVNLLVSGFLFFEYSQIEKRFEDRILKVRGLVVADSTGVERVIIAAPLPKPIILGKRFPRGDNVSGVMLYDAEGNERGGYVTSDSYPNVFLTLDDLGRQRALFLAEPQGATSLFLWADNNNQFNLTTTDEETSLEVLSNGKHLIEEK